ncbi:MAG: class II fructose-bisphosphatase [archaeon]
MPRAFMLDFARVTEDAAIASARLVGRGDRHEADRVAVEAMRARLNKLELSGTVVIGEGERDEAPMLFIGEVVGNPEAKEQFDIAVDPLECTNSVAFGLGNAMSVLVVSPKGTLLHAPDLYMNKISVGPLAKDAVDLDKSVEANIRAVAKALGKPVSEVTVIVLDRPRHESLIKEIRKTGARIRLISDGDISGAIAPSIEKSGIDLLLGIGAAPEGVLAAAALKCLGGFMQGRLQYKDEAQRERARKMGISNLDEKMNLDKLVRSNECIFIATGITEGPFLEGVRFDSGKITTQTIIMRAKTKTLRVLNATHLAGDDEQKEEKREK